MASDMAFHKVGIKRRLKLWPRATIKIGGEEFPVSTLADLLRQARDERAAEPPEEAPPQ